MTKTDMDSRNMNWKETDMDSRNMNSAETDMKSKNMNYWFNVEYYKDLEYIYHINQDGYEKEKEEDEKKLKKRDGEIEDFNFCGRHSAVEKFFNKAQEDDGKKSFILYTAYPGVMIGTGNPHEVSMENAIKCGFSFDYVSGLPYIPGPAMKGMLRSYFPKNDSADEQEKREYIRGLLQSEECGVFTVENQEEAENTFIDSLKQNLFEADDVFLDAFPVVKQQKGAVDPLLAREYITPHKKEYKNPNPINMIKIKSEVKIRFMFILNEFRNENYTISADQKLALLKRIILDMGVGAKTNVGFGIMTENPPQENKEVKKKINNTYKKYKRG